MVAVQKLECIICIMVLFYSVLSVVPKVLCSVYWVQRLDFVMDLECVHRNIFRELSCPFVGLVVLLGM